MSAVGFAVAGGRSRRMGRDKALLAWGATDLLGHALARLGRVVEDVRILSGVERRYTERGVPVQVDPAPNLGPLGGLLAALESAPGRPVLLLGIDLPLVTPALLRRLVALAGEGEAVVPVSSRGPEPVCALYGPACLEFARRCVAARRLHMTAFWPEVRVREVSADELGDLGNPEELFLNVNTPADHTRARALAPRLPIEGSG